MAGSKSNYLELALLDHVLGGGNYARPGTLYLALFSVLPGEDGTGGTELSAGNYARLAITNNAVNFPAAAGGQKSNGAAFAMGTASVDWGEAVGWGLYDAAVAGNLLYYGNLQGARKTTSGAAATDLLTAPAHGYIAGTKVRLEQIGDLSLPTGVVAGTTYFVRDVTTNTFKLAAAVGGAAIDLTADGAAYVIEWKAQIIQAGNPVSFEIGALVIQED